MVERLSIPGETPLDIHPGDTLIVRIGVEHATQEMVDQLHEGLRYELPESVKVLVVTADQLAVVRG